VQTTRSHGDLVLKTGRKGIDLPRDVLAIKTQLYPKGEDVSLLGGEVKVRNYPPKEVGKNIALAIRIGGKNYEVAPWGGRMGGV